eukprot:462375-Ditylum_brightwellii.AAC.1
MTAHNAYAGTPQLIDYISSSDDQDYFSGSDADSDVDSDNTNYNNAIEHNMAQFLQEDDHVMPSDEENQSPVAPLQRNEDENTINDCFDKIKNGVRPQTRFHDHTK